MDDVPLLCALPLDVLSTDAQGLSLGHPHVARVIEATSGCCCDHEAEKEEEYQQEEEEATYLGQPVQRSGSSGEFRWAAPFCTDPPPNGAAPSTPPGKRIGLYLTQTGPPSVSDLAGASVGDRSSMGGRSGGSATVSQTQWRHAVSVDGVGRVVQVRVGRTVQRQDRPFPGPSLGTPPETGSSASSASIANGSRQRILQSHVSAGLEKALHSPLFDLRGNQSLGDRTVQPHPERTLVSLFDRRQQLDVRGRAPPGGARVQRQLVSEHRAGAARRDAPQRTASVAPIVSPTVATPALTQVKGRRPGPFEQTGKGYLPEWTEEVFVVRRVVPGSVPTYKVEEFDGTLVQGTFYEPG